MFHVFDIIFLGNVAGWMAGWMAGWLCVTLQYCIKTAKPVLKLFRTSVSPIILVSSSMRRCQIPRGTPSAGL